MSNSRWTWLALGVLGTIWGVNFLLMKIAVGVISPFQVAWLRVLFGAVPVLLVGASRGVIRLEHWRHWPHFLAIGVFSVVVPFVGLTLAAARLPSGASGAMAGMVPLLTVGLAALTLPGESLTRRKTAGLVSGFLGVCLVGRIWTLSGSGAQDAVLGTLCVLAAGMGYASGMVYTKRFVVPLKLSPMALSCYQLLVAGLLLTVGVDKVGVERLWSAPAALLSVALGLGLLGTGVAFILYFRLIDQLGAMTASSVFYIPPLVALLVGSSIGREAILPVQWLGAFAILGGVFLSREAPKP